MRPPRARTDRRSGSGIPGPARVAAAAKSRGETVPSQSVSLLSDDDLARAAGGGVGPHPQPWPDDPQLDPELLAAGDTRNVVDRYRYWTVPAIVADLDSRRHLLHVAIQNWEHDFNIGSIVRTANAFNVGGVHILGRRRWNRRGAMVTDRYLPISHHEGVSGFTDWLTSSGYQAIGVDNLPGAVALEDTELPERVCLVFGDRKSTRLNSSHANISYAVFCLKKK